MNKSNKYCDVRSDVLSDIPTIFPFFGVILCFLLLTSCVNSQIKASPAQFVSNGVRHDSSHYPYRYMQPPPPLYLGPGVYRHRTPLSSSSSSGSNSLIGDSGTSNGPSSHLIRPSNSYSWPDLYRQRMTLWQQQVHSHVPSTNYHSHTTQLYNGTCQTNVCRTYGGYGSKSVSGTSLRLSPSSKFAKIQCKCPQGKVCKTIFTSEKREGLCVTPDYQPPEENATDMHPYMTELLSGVP
ncbi:uncharacterized protein LOC142336182 [Convolutriloba macropyga]|uniref:uncharacterized protein LOC142336182 n=1 Tax=Convolutriloba macropyga TaxID=536237 RepID=UPI003F51B27F